MLSEVEIDGFITFDEELMRCNSWGSLFPLAPSRCRGLLSLCISDAAKRMLLNNDGFIPHLIDGLLLDPEHKRQTADEAVKAVVQRDFTECLQQISLFPAGREILKENKAAMQALSTLKDKAWSKDAKRCAQGALMALNSPVPNVHAVEAFHIMMSCECISRVSINIAVSRWDRYGCAALP